MAELPQSLAKYDDQTASLDTAADDNSLVKVRTLKGWMARLIKMIPNPGGGMAVRRTPTGDVWAQTVEARPFQISSTGKVHPGLVGGQMPKLAGVALDTTTNVLDLSAHGGNFYVYFKLTFSVTYLSTFLSSYTLNSVTVEEATSIPADTDAIKYLPFNTITDGQPAASYFTASIPIALYDNGANATTLHYGT